MKRFSPFKILVFILLSVPWFYIPLNSQMPMRGISQVRITGWADDTHYLLQTFDSEKNLVIQSVDVRSGKSTIVAPQKSDREILSESLPKGVTIGFNDVVSSDMNSLIIVKDNDLFYFKKGDKELRRLTNDKIPEVNTRFSPDGKKIAYTKNKDLYVYDLVA